MGRASEEASEGREASSQAHSMSDVETGLVHSDGAARRRHDPLFEEGI
jgi:hypothetical protein